MSNLSPQSRLFRDYKEIKQNPISTVSAIPLDDDIFEWHCNLAPNTGLFTGYVLHLIMHFTDKYPNEPPKIKLCTHLKHPNIFRNYICLDMLKPITAYGSDKYTGWTSAYSVQSILLQLQSFLFDENVPQEYGPAIQNKQSIFDVEKSKLEMKEFKCSCQHSYDNIYPPLYNTTININNNINSLGFPILLSKSFENALDDGDCKIISNNMCGNTHRKKWCGVYSKMAFRIGAQNTYSVYFEIIPLEGDGFSRIGWVTEQGDCKIGIDKYGYGYGATGVKSHNNKFEPYGPGFTVSDVVGTLLNLSNGNIYFFKNGVNLGCAFVVPQNTLLYCAVSMRNMKVQVNFTDFKFMPNTIKLSDVLADQKSVYHQDTEDNTDNNDYFSVLIQDMLFAIFSYLTVQELYILQKVCKRFRKIITDNRLIERVELTCFHSKLNYNETLLGYGVDIQYNIRDNSIGTISTQLDLMSYRVFCQGHKLSVWKHSFNNFIPLVFNNYYQKKYNYDVVLAECIGRIVNKQYVTSQDCFNVITKILNQLVVSFMLDQSNQIITQHLSEKILVGYYSFYHILIYLHSKHPAVIKNFEKDCNDFIQNPNYRTKKHVPDMGIWLIKLGLSNISWDQVKYAFIEEVFDRNVRWCIDKYPELQYLDKKEECYYRIQKTFDANITSLRLIMFQYYFLKNINLTSSLEDFNQCLGIPSQHSKVELYQMAVKIKNLKSWVEFFKFVDLPPLIPNKLTKLLRQSVRNSLNKQYHKPKPYRRITEFPVVNKAISHYD